MRTLGLIGGTSWHSTVEYYQNINRAVNTHFGDNTNPPLVLFNLNQSLVHRYQREDRWDKVAKLIVEGGLRLQKAGAETLIFCANTPHKVFDSVQKQLEIPILHIADATARAIQQQHLSKVCFLGTKFSMEEDFITSRLENHGLSVLVPAESSEREELHRIIQQELTYGRIENSSKGFVLESINRMAQLGAQGVILGCTEFPLMVGPQDLNFPIFNTTEIHSQAATDYILNTDNN